MNAWWLHERPRGEMWSALSQLSRFIASPKVTKHRLFVWLPAGTVPDQQLIVFARDDDYTFGILQSRVHELWARGTGTQLREVESGFRYTPTTTFETFPFPHPAEEQRQTTAVLARRLVELRDSWLNPPGLSGDELAPRTLTYLYNERPTWLANAHADLDLAVLDAYAWPPDLDDNEVLERLLELNLQRSTA